MRGAPAAAALDEKTGAAVQALKARGISPTLAILRVGARDGDLSYERGAVKRCEKLGIALRLTALPETVCQTELMGHIDALNADASVHGILMLRPLPAHLDGEAARKAISPEKDVDGCTDGSLAGVFTGTALGFPPCTARSALEILDYYGVELSGKRACVMGRSLVVGRPLALLLTHRDATVTLCHSKSADAPAIVRQADIVVVCTGRTETVGAEYFRPGQTVVDVGIGWSEAKQKLCGDVRFDEAEPIVAAITPVPGGVGSVTTAVLAAHTVEAAGRYAEKLS